MGSRVMPTRGMRDFLPTEKAKRERVLALLRDTYASLGFQEIETPAMEPIERLKSGQGGENEKMLFEVMRRGLSATESVAVGEACDLGMRYDLTLPLSRYFATHQQELPSVFRAFQTGPVWRAERPQKGRFRQFNQVDIDLLGSSSPLAEIEVLSSGWIVAQRLGLAENATILINDRRLLTQLMQGSSIAEENFTSVLIALDKLEKIGPEKVKQELQKAGVNSDQQAEQLLAAVQELGETTLDPGVSTIYLSNWDVELSVWDLPEIIAQLRMLHPEISIRFEPTLVRGMGYYTGPIFEIVHTDSNSSICGGGRYDRVIGRWSNRDIPAVGLSFGFERIIDLVSLTNDGQEGELALAYQKDDEARAALKLRNAMIANLSDLPLARVGLYKAPRKINAGFYAELQANGYNAVLLPSAFMQVDLADPQVLSQLVNAAKRLS